MLGRDSAVFARAVFDGVVLFSARALRPRIKDEADTAADRRNDRRFNMIFLSRLIALFVNYRNIYKNLYGFVIDWSDGTVP